jgi:hypothetical protein
MVIVRQTRTFEWQCQRVHRNPDAISNYLIHVIMPFLLEGVGACGLAEGLFSQRTHRLVELAESKEARSDMIGCAA